MKLKHIISLVVLGLGLFAIIIITMMSANTVPAGQVGAVTLFGKVQPNTYSEGLHFINPLADMNLYDVKQKTHKESAGVPSQDQLTTNIDVSVQYRIDKKQVVSIIQETGSPEQAINVHMIPKLRSLIREQGKSVLRAEDFFLEETQQRLQVSVTDGLKTFLGPKGIIIEAVLIRNISLPKFITKAIEEKKTREQEAEKQKAELARFKTEQEQKVATAQAELEASRAQAEQKKVLADAQAYEIAKVNEAISDSPGYVQLQALEALKAISKDDSSKIYFINGESPQPLPLMHMGGTIK